MLLSPMSVGGITQSFVNIQGQMKFNLCNLAGGRGEIFFSPNFLHLATICWTCNSLTLGTAESLVGKQLAGTSSRWKNPTLGLKQEQWVQRWRRLSRERTFCTAKCPRGISKASLCVLSQSRVLLTGQGCL